MMKNAWLSALIHACQEILYYLPIVLLLNHFTGVKNLVLVSVVILLSYLLGYALGRFRFIRFVEWLLCIMIGAAVSLAMIGLTIGGVIFIVLTTIAVMRGYRFRFTPWSILFQHNAYIISISIYFVTPLIFLFYPELKQYSIYLYWAGLYCIIHTLFIINFKQVEMASQNTQAGQSTALNVRRANRIGTGVVVIILFIVINIERLLQFVKSYVIQFLNWLNEFFSRPQAEQPTEPPLPAENMGGMELGEAVERSLLSEILDKIIYYLAYVILFIIVMLLLYFIVMKLIVPMLSRFLTTAKLTRELHEGYSDEEEKLEAPKLGNWFRSLVHRSPGQPEPQDNGERVRLLYRNILKSAVKRGYEFQMSYTPLEVEQNWQAQKMKQRLPIRLMSLYNKARYGEIPITDEELKKLKGDA